MFTSTRVITRRVLCRPTYGRLAAAEGDGSCCKAAAVVVTVFLLRSRSDPDASSTPPAGRREISSWFFFSSRTVVNREITHAHACARRSRRGRRRFLFNLFCGFTHLWSLVTRTGRRYLRFSRIRHATDYRRLLFECLWRTDTSKNRTAFTRHGDTVGTFPVRYMILFRYNG